MVQIGVALYCLALWVGIVFGAYMPDSLLGALALIIVSALVLAPFVPRIMGLFLTSLSIAPNAPPHRPRPSTGRVLGTIGAPGTPGASEPRAPAVA